MARTGVATRWERQKTPRTRKLVGERVDKRLHVLLGEGGDDVDVDGPTRFTGD